MFWKVALLNTWSFFLRFLRNFIIHYNTVMAARLTRGGQVVPHWDFDPSKAKNFFIWNYKTLISPFWWMDPEEPQTLFKIVAKGVACWGIKMILHKSQRRHNVKTLLYLWDLYSWHTNNIFNHFFYCFAWIYLPFVQLHEYLSVSLIFARKTMVIYYNDHYWWNERATCSVFSRVQHIKPNTGVVFYILPFHRLNVLVLWFLNLAFLKNRECT